MIGRGALQAGDGRLTCLNGCRGRELETRIGVLNLRVPKLKQGCCLPGLIEPRRRRPLRGSPAPGANDASNDQRLDWGYTRRS